MPLKLNKSLLSGSAMRLDKSFLTNRSPSPTEGVGATSTVVTELPQVNPADGMDWRGVEKAILSDGAQYATLSIKSMYAFCGKEEAEALIRKRHGEAYLLKVQEERGLLSEASVVEKAYKLDGRCVLDGLNVSIENDTGSTRSGTDPDGKEWSTTMKSPYGYIRGTKGVDGDHLDVFLGPEAQKVRKGEEGDLSTVYIVHANDIETGKYDEDKCMLGYASKTEAVEDFKRHYDSPERFLGPVSEMTWEEFKSKIADTRENPRRLAKGEMFDSKEVAKACGYDKEMQKAQGKSTPADPSEQIEGSSKNKEGSASTGSGSISLSDETVTALESKVKEHNDKYEGKGKKATLGALKAVYRRGAGAFSSSHRPGMNRNQWSMGRVNAFLHLLSKGTPKDADYTTDNDLLPSAHQRSTKKAVGVPDVPKVEVPEVEVSEDEDVEEVKKAMNSELDGMAEEVEKALDACYADTEKAIPAKYSHIDFKPPQSVQDEAERGLEMRADATPSNRGGLTTAEAGKQGIGSGVSRASQLKRGSNVSPKVIGQMANFFNRHSAYKHKHKSDPGGKAQQSWKLWGGNAGRSWANKIKRQMDAADKKDS